MLYIAPWKAAVTAAVVVLGLLLCIPNFFSEAQVAHWPSWIPHRQITLGLDLQGGSHLLLEVDTQQVVRDKLQQISDQCRTTRRNEKSGYTGLGVDQGRVEVTIRNPDDFGRALDKLKAIAQPVGGNLLGGGGNLDLLIQSAPNNKVTFE